MRYRFFNFVKPRIIAAILLLSPKFLLTWIVNKVAKNNNKLIKNSLILAYIKFYKIDLQLYQKKDISLYTNFHSFFIRDLDLPLRIINPEAKLIIPADGLMTAVGQTDPFGLYQAKNRLYTLKDLFGGDPDYNKFTSGSYFTIYLSPKDYHKIHMPCDGILEKMIYVPGKLFSVNQTSCENISNLYTRNERVIIIFKIASGYMVIILVGAMIVGSVFTSWHGQVTPNRNILRSYKKNKVEIFNYSPIQLNKFDELGYFQMGSTVITLFSEHYDFDENFINQVVLFGQALC